MIWDSLQDILRLPHAPAAWTRRDRLPRCAPHHVPAQWWEAAQVAHYREQVLR
ncbi:hypothetical protein [Streptomyces sp. NPDC016845]|uniref:hypothetical protein n=1 Tax=Streptomyces sp. NPDC016845 TaxID=3364972 RepID=UPI0037A99778